MEVETARFVFARSAGEHLKNSFPVDAFAAASLGLEGSISEDIDVIANHTRWCSEELFETARSVNTRS